MKSTKRSARFLGACLLGTLPLQVGALEEFEISPAAVADVAEVGSDEDLPAVTTPADESAVVAQPPVDAGDAEDSDDDSDDGEPKKKKKKKKDAADGEAGVGAKAGIDEGGEKPEKPKKKKKDEDEEDDSNPGDWCDWLSGNPGQLYRDKKNPYIQRFRINGRFQYQAAYQDGSDVNGRNYHDSYDEFRRFRIETRTDFLQYFTAELGVNLVSDDRFRGGPGDDLDWGYDRFDKALLTFDFGSAFGTGPFDSVEVAYGRMKLRITEEAHQSSRRIITIERSSLSDSLGGEFSRPTGGTIAVGKGDWSLTLGAYSGEDDADFLSGWNDGVAYYGSLAWQATKNFRLLLDHVQNHQRGADDAIGYAQATSLAAVFEEEQWGILANVAYGDNGGAGQGRPQARRQGDFHGLVIMPWYWIVKDRLQAVVQYQYGEAERSEGLQLTSRYIRAGHEDPLVDTNNGRGDEHHSLYLGLNYHLCGDNAKIMAAITYDELSTPSGRLDALTYLIGFRTYF